MNRIIFTIIFITIFSYASFAQEIDLKAHKLDSAYRILMADFTSKENQELFFHLFPTNFEEFVITYQLPGIKMHHRYHDHISYGFAELNKIDSIQYTKRLINLSINGKWEADAVAELQEILHKKMKNNTELFFSILKNYKKEDIYSFWFFFFHSVLKRDGIPNYLKEKKHKYPIMLNIIMKAFKEANGEVSF